MATNTDPYCAVHNYDFSSIVYLERVEPSGGELEVEEISSPTWSHAEIRAQGRKARKWVIHARSTDRDEIETFLETLNTVPEDAEFWPVEAGRSGRVGLAHAVLQPVRFGAGHNFYEAEGVITCREPWMYGPDKGIVPRWSAALPLVESITNEGQEDAPMDVIECRGEYYGSEYNENLTIRILPTGTSARHDRDLELCDKLLRGDLFRVGWHGDVIHSYEPDFRNLWASISIDVHGKTSGGSISSEVLTLDNSDYMMIPLYGPLPVSGDADAAKIELTVDALTGNGATVWYALATNLSDIAEVDHDDLVVGENEIYIPDLEGETHVALGIKAAASGSVGISALKAEVKRYIAPSQMPVVESGETVDIRVETTAGDKLRYLAAIFNDRYYY
jgi:hypothetical protein